jgi:hypothetical protein
MERLLMMRLDVRGCSAEVLLNDIPVGRVAPRDGALCMPVHEYLLEGDNEISLVIDPGAPGRPAATAPKVAEEVVGVSFRLLVPRTGQVASSLTARSVAEIEWAVPSGDVYTTPLTLTRSAVLPVKFPRWRWLDVPEIADIEAQRPLIAAFLQGIAVDMLRGDAESFLTASRLRIEELGQAYGQPVAELVTRMRSRLHLLHATKALKMTIPSAPEFVFRRCANGRLIECLGGNGAPLLSTLPAPDGTSSAWPVRLAVVGGRCHILR